ncbi:MAG: hypothetical protein QOD77_614 [Thermoplasmata archaeon]|jgi:hypothetical protein|nr:hypothetical protein [Thermoplasmata archaeon]
MIRGRSLAEGLLVPAAIAFAFYLWSRPSWTEPIPGWALVVAAIVAILGAALWASWFGPALRWATLGRALGFRMVAAFPGALAHPLVWPSFEGIVQGRRVRLDIQGMSSTHGAYGKSPIQQSIVLPIATRVEMHGAMRMARRRKPPKGLTQIYAAGRTKWHASDPSLAPRLKGLLDQLARVPLAAGVWTVTEDGRRFLVYRNSWEQLDEARAKALLPLLAAIAAELEKT